MRFLALVVCGVVPVGRADVRLAGIFTDHMVLQRQMPAPVWGWAEAGEKVTVSFDTQEKIAIADAAGKWMVKLDPLQVGPARTLKAAGKNLVELKDVLVGEVWICSGQSGMEVGFGFMPNQEEELAAANVPELRLFQMDQRESAGPQAEVTPMRVLYRDYRSADAPKPRWGMDAGWLPASSRSVILGGWQGFTAQGYCFGQELQKELGVPVGLINACAGGTCIGTWMPRPVLEAEPLFKDYLEMWKPRLAEFQADAAEFDKAMVAWGQQVDQAEKDGKAPPRKPAYANKSHWYPANRYNGMIAPLIPFAFRGVIWDQGFSDRTTAEAYKTTFPLMIRTWRELWGQGDFPFYFLHYQNQHSTANSKNQDKMLAAPEEIEPKIRQPLAEMREAQVSGLKEPNTGMIVTIDLSKEGLGHFPDKRPVGRRWLNLALAETYGRKGMIARSPRYQSMSVEGDKIRIHFSDIGDKLVVKGDAALTWFTIAGDDRAFAPAEAKRDGDTVLVWSAKVPAPRAVRYIWADNPDPTTIKLYNQAGLPVAPFRTDNWPFPPARAQSRPARQTAEN
jgi:sialate O-acetylesterase